MAVVSIQPAAPSALPPSDMDRIEHLRTALLRIHMQATVECAIDPNGFDRWVRDYTLEAVGNDDKAALAQDAAQQAADGRCAICGKPSAIGTHIICDDLLASEQPL